MTSPMLSRGQNLTLPPAIRRVDAVLGWADSTAEVGRIWHHESALSIATEWAPVGEHGDARVREHLAVVRFTIGKDLFAALNIDEYGRAEGDWYTTVTRHASSRLPLGDLAGWSQITERSVHVQVATGWRQLE